MSDKKQKWSSEDEKKLLNLISENKSLERISKKLKIKEKDIIYKLKKIASKMSNENKTREEIANTLKYLTNDQIKKILERVNKKKSAKDYPMKLSDEFSEIGLNKTKLTNKKNIYNDIPNNNSDIEKIYTLLDSINKKIDLIIETKNNNTNINKQLIKPNSVNNSVNNSSSNSNPSSISSSSSSSNTPNPKSNTKKNKATNNKESSSFISEGSDTHDILNLIQNRTNQINEAKNKYKKNNVKIINNIK